jgi:hypothetical protein
MFLNLRMVRYPQRFAAVINQLRLEHLNFCVNLHQPSHFSSEAEDTKG